jgi:hypothetical protein
MNTSQRIPLCNLLLAFALLLVGPVSASGQRASQRDKDSPEAAFPKSFDSKHEYSSYNYDSLLDHIEISFKITNTFVGERVKVIALYGETLATINRTKPPSVFTSLMGAYGCIDPICDKLEAVTGEDVSIDKSLSRAFRGLGVYVYIRDPRQYGLFLRSASIYSALNPCYLLAAGTIQMSKVHIRNAIGIVLERDIIYIDTDKIALFKSSDNIGAKLIAKGIWSGFSLGLKVYSNFGGSGQ